MKVLDLRCSQQHDFEGWFGSEQDFASQQQRGLLTCPLCGHHVVHKLLSAPRLNLRAAHAPAAASPTAAQTGQDPGSIAAIQEPAAPSKAQQAQLLEAVRRLLAQTEDVGARFAQQALAMHQGETPHRNIRGQATAAQARELIEEGVEIVPVPMLPALKETLQ